MIHADKLNEAARVIDASAEHNNSASPLYANGLRIIAADLRAEAQAGEGYQTRATLALAIVIDNDRWMADRRRDLMMANLPTDWTDDDAVAEARANFAKALQEVCEVWAGTEGIARVHSNDPNEPTGWLGRSQGAASLPDVASALVHYAITCVDWHGLAAHYLSEHRLSEVDG